MRPLWFDFPAQEGLFATQDVFMLGPALLAAPVLEAGATNRTVVMPYGSVWYDYWTGVKVDKASAPRDPVANVKRVTVDVDLKSMPLFVKGGSVFTRKERARRSTAAMSSDPVTVVVVVDGAGRARGDLYVDDGSSYAFQRGDFVHRALVMDKGVLRNTAATVGGDVSRTPGLVVERLVFMGLEGGPGKWGVVHGERALEAAPGACNVRAGGVGCLVVRKPGLSVAEDWEVKLVAK